ncbi:Sugar or nucleoside kinase, ribokinase family [Micromonospora nigra]|uniref:Sugar or nucleoside kinase, ribokinase family n=1 Tax=Micromonospora nigra TaxID=145857 RepID=A0A1C6RHT9_9ACTN|nr:carbohydrate kinase family protein [Micromonospora nigra]SCL16697.1 Sugar or nucleoside kinase, ribokinase family [Micromonospora nigra]
MFDLLVVGGLGVDVRVRVPGMPLPVVDSLLVDPIDLRIGNTGAGVALAAHALGLRVAVLDTVGADAAGDVVRAALARTGVHAVLRDDPAGTRRSVNLVDPAGRRMSLHDPRPPAGPTPITAAEVAALVNDATHVHVSIMGWVRDLLPDLRGVLGEGVGTSTDLHDWDGRNPYHRPFAETAELVLVSGVRLDDRAATVAASLAPRPVLVTRGADGADLHVGGHVTRVPGEPPPGPVVDTNGAGDAVVAGMVAARLRGATWVEAAGYGARVAAAACTHDGMEYPPGLLPHL